MQRVSHRDKICANDCYTTGFRQQLTFRKLNCLKDALNEAARLNLDKGGGGPGSALLRYCLVLFRGV
jgi:hypothetical protein